MSKRSRERFLKKRKKTVKTNKKRLKYYPVMFCTDEDICIAVSTQDVKLKSDRFGRIQPQDRVSDKHWRPMNCTFRSKEYIFDMSTYDAGEEVFCKKCGNKIDFRLFPSHSIPILVELSDEKIKKDSVEKLPNS